MDRQIKQQVPIAEGDPAANNDGDGKEGAEASRPSRRETRHRECHQQSQRNDEALLGCQSIVGTRKPASSEDVFNDLGLDLDTRQSGVEGVARRSSSPGVLVPMRMILPAIWLSSTSPAKSFQAGMKADGLLWRN